MNSTSMRRTTVTGNSSTIPKGTDIDEFPLNRMRRRKKANRGDTRVLERSVIEGIIVFEERRW